MSRHISRCKIFWLFVGATLMIILSTFPVSSTASFDTQKLFGNETNENYSTSFTNKTELMKQETELSFHFLKSIMQMLDLSLDLMNTTLGMHVEEYPFLKPTANGTDEGVKTVDSIISVLQANPENLSDIQTKLIALNETMAQFNTSANYPDEMLKAANSPLGDNMTAPMNRDMFNDVQKMISLYDQL